MGQIPSYWLIGVHKERQKVLGYRVASLKHKKFIDLAPDKLKAILMQQANDFGNIAISQNNIVGTQGQLDRYTAIRGNRAENKALVVLAKVLYRSGETLGFIVVDYRYQFCGVKSPDEIINACADPLKLRLANASIVESESKKFIRAITGEFKTIVDEKAPYSKPVAQPVKNNSSIKKEAESEIKAVQAVKEQIAQAVKTPVIKHNGFEYRLSQQVGDSNEWEKAEYDGYGARFIGFDPNEDADTDHYVIKPLKEINGKPVLGLAHAFDGIKNSLIDLREFKFNQAKNVKGVFNKTKLCWVFVDNIENKETFKEMFDDSSVTVVTKIGSQVQKEATELNSKVVPFRRAQLQEWYRDQVERHSKGKGFGVVVCGKD